MFSNVLVSKLPILPRCILHSRYFSSSRNYIQGQNDPVKSKIREYFYFIDHNGMLFLDDSRMKNFTSCFKEKVFLNFFFKNIKFNKSGRYENEFPYVSLCGIERNFIRCDDVPIVFTHIVPGTDNKFDLVINYSDLKNQFVPESLYMLPESIERKDAENDEDSVLEHGGRIYHRASQKLGGYGLIRSVLAQELGSRFKLDERRVPIQFRWEDKVYTLNNELAAVISKKNEI